MADETTYARQRARLTSANAEMAEIELRSRKGELLERTAIAATFGPWIRQLREDLLGIPRDHVVDPVQAAACEDGLAAALGAFAQRLGHFTAEPATHGGDTATG